MKNTISKIATAFAALLLVPMVGFAQGQKASPPDKVSNTIGNATVTISYSQPSVKGRTIWGGLVPYGKVWRTGANEATTFEVSSDVKIGDQTLKSGKYSLFTIPSEEEWTFIFNEETGQWGTNHNAEKDVIKVKATPEESAQMTEKMTFEIADDGMVSLMWENLKVGFQVSPIESASSTEF